MLSTFTPTDFSLEKLARPNILALKPYASARDEFEGEAEVFLDANENPFDTTEGFNRYPDPHQKKLKKRLSELKNIAAKHIFLGNGSDEPIDLLIRIFCTPHQDAILTLAPTYGMYEVSAQIHAVAMQEVKLNPDFTLPLADIFRAIDASTKLIFICSPNNPTGNRFAVADILSICARFQGIVVVDEAYIDFCEPDNSLVAQLEKYPNLVVLQTLSKAWGMAGLRLGLAFASAEIIALMNKVKPPYNINSFTQQAVWKILQNPTTKTAQVEAILAQRATLAAALAKLPIVLQVFPSEANFLLVRFRDAEAVYNYLLQHQIIVRNRSKQPLCDNCLRITIGTVHQNQALMQALGQYPQT